MALTTATVISSPGISDGCGQKHLQLPVRMMKQFELYRRLLRDTDENYEIGELAVMHIEHCGFGSLRRDMKDCGPFILASIYKWQTSIGWWQR